MEENTINLEIDFSGTHKHLGGYYICGTIPGKVMIRSEHMNLFFVINSIPDGDKVTFGCGNIDIDNEDRFDLISTAILSSLQAMSCIASIVSHTKSSIVVKIVSVDLSKSIMHLEENMTAKYAYCLNCAIVYTVGRSRWGKTSLKLKDFLEFKGSRSSQKIAAAISCPKCKDYKFSPGWEPGMALQEDYYYT